MVIEGLTRGDRMKIESVKLGPYERSLLPGLRLEVCISYKKNEQSIIGVNGWLQADDGKLISRIGEAPEELDVTRATEIAARGSSQDSTFREDIYKTVLLAIIDQRALDHIEKRRMMNPKGDVNLSLSLVVKTLDSKVQVSHVHEIDPEILGLRKAEIAAGSTKTTDWFPLVYAHDTMFSAGRINRWLLSGTSGPVFVAVTDEILQKRERVPSADWIHEYAPVLGLGEYFVVEIPKGNKTIGDAWRYVEKAEESYRQWNTKGVYANCRECGKVLDTSIKQRFGKDSFVYKERWGRTFGRFEAFASLNLHIEDIKESPQYRSQDLRVQRPDVEHVMIVSKALVKYAEQLLQEAA